MQALRVEPVDVGQRRPLYLIWSGPGSLVVDQLGLVEPVEALGESVDAPIGQDRISGGFGELQPGSVIDHHSLVDLSSQVALQAPDDVLLRESLLGPHLPHGPSK